MNRKLTLVSNSITSITRSIANSRFSNRSRFSAKTYGVINANADGTSEDVASSREISENKGDNYCQKSFSHTRNCTVVSRGKKTSRNCRFMSCNRVRFRTKTNYRFGRCVDNRLRRNWRYAVLIRKLLLKNVLLRATTEFARDSASSITKKRFYSISRWIGKKFTYSLSFQL